MESFLNQLCFFKHYRAKLLTKNIPPHKSEKKIKNKLPLDIESQLKFYTI